MFCTFKFQQGWLSPVYSGRLHHEDQRLCRTNDTRFIQNCEVPEEVSVTFDPEIDLDDDAVGRSRYERFFRGN